MQHQNEVFADGEWTIDKYVDNSFSRTFFDFKNKYIYCIS